MTSGPALVAFLMVATAVTGSMLFGARLLRVRANHDSRLKTQTYECGEAPEGGAWVRFHARYYLVALFFVLFDLEAAFLLPWATVARGAGPAGLVAVGSFVAVLMVGWAWAMKKGALQWH